MRLPSKQCKKPNERHTLRKADQAKGMLLPFAMEDGGEAILSA